MPTDLRRRTPGVGAGLWLGVLFALAAELALALVILALVVALCRWH